MRTKSILFSFSKFAAGVIMTLVAALTISAKLQAAENCGALASGVLQGATVKSAEMRPAGRFSSPDGHYPAELPACEMVALMTAEPGACAVATPFSSMVTTEAGCTLYCRWPTRQLILFDATVLSVPW